VSADPPDHHDLSEELSMPDTQAPHLDEVPVDDAVEVSVEEAAGGLSGAVLWTPQPNDDGPELSEYADPTAEVDQQVRRYPSTIGGLLYLLVLGAAAFGIALSLTGHWRASIVWIGSALLAGAFFRLVLPESQAGMLHVRRRLVDVALLVVLGGALLITVSIR